MFDDYVLIAGCPVHFFLQQLEYGARAKMAKGEKRQMANWGLLHPVRKKEMETTTYMR